MRLAVHQPQYLPWLGYFAKMAAADVFVFQDDVPYKHREWQNANQIRTSGGAQRLSVPVLTDGRQGQLICDVEIDNTQPWRRKHWKAVYLSYRGARCFGRYAERFEWIYAQQWTKLVDLNLHIIDLIRHELRIDTPVLMESTIETGDRSKEDRIVEVCRQLGADTYLSGAGGREWMCRKPFKAAEIRLEFQEFRHPVYPQLYGDFLPFMSAIDLIFNVGDESADVLREASRRRPTTAGR